MPCGRASRRHATCIIFGRGDIENKHSTDVESTINRNWAVRNDDGKRSYDILGIGRQPRTESACLCASALKICHALTSVRVLGLIDPPVWLPVGGGGDVDVLRCIAWSWLYHGRAVQVGLVMPAESPWCYLNVLGFHAWSSNMMMNHL